jgi:hypothetical protein
MSATDCSFEGEAQTERQFVTDNSPWQPPSISNAEGAATPFAAPGEAPVAPAAFGQPPAGWTPPPKPGLIPLRPLTLGTMLGASFQVLRRNPRPMFGFSLLLTGLIFVLTFLLVGVVAYFAVSRIATATGADVPTIEAGTVAIVILAAIVPLVLSLVLGAILQGIVVLEVARGTVGEKLKLGGLWRAAKGRIGALIGWTLLITAAVIIAFVVVSLLVGLVIAFGGTAGLVGGILLGIAAGLGATVLALWLMTRLALVPSVLMIERLPLRDAIRRAWSLTIGFFWKTLGIQLLVAVIVQVAASIITTPLSFLFGFGTFLINPNGEESGFMIMAVVLYVLTIILTLVIGAIAAVVQTATTSLIYIDLRMRKEGLDLELTRFVEARNAGDASVPDPYLARTPAS